MLQKVGSPRGHHCGKERVRVPPLTREDRPTRQGDIGGGRSSTVDVG